MNILVPNIKEIISKIIQSDIEPEFDGRKQKIAKWAEEQKMRINGNKKIVKEKTELNDIKILNLFLPCLLARNIRGEAVNKISKRLNEKVKIKADLIKENYLYILNGYKWGTDIGVSVINKVIKWLDENNWDWKTYFELAEKNKDDNFQQDELLKIKNIWFKLRDLALSEFNKNYIAFDLHVARVMTRIGLLNYGFEILGNEIKIKNERNDIEMGNNTTNDKHYLFLHKLALKLSELLDNKYSLSDLDRIFWHFGRTICSSNPKCGTCPIKDICLTGKNIK